MTPLNSGAGSQTDSRGHTHIMQQALELSRQALPYDVPVGALLLHQGNIIAEAYNTRERDQNPVGHAEILALQAASQTLKRWRLDGCTLYVTLEPCPMCASAIAQARISQVVYGAHDPLAGACGSKYHLIPASTPVVGGVLESECKALLDNFFQSRRSEKAE